MSLVLCHPPDARQLTPTLGNAPRQPEDEPRGRLLTVVLFLEVTLAVNIGSTQQTLSSYL